MNRLKIAVTGAAGQIGYALLFRLASGAAFGPDVEIELNCLELEAALPALEGTVMELMDCAFPLLKNVNITSDVNEAMKDVNYAILVGSVPRKKGMERSDLLKINGGVFSVQGKAINDHAASDVRVFVVGNPCNTNCLIAMHHAPDLRKDRFFAMTMLDQNRAKAQIAMKAKVDVKEVSDMVIWGNHSSTQYPDFYHAKIGDKLAIDVIDDMQWFQTEFIETVQKRGAAIIKARGASSAASAANAVIESLYQMTHDTETLAPYSLCKYSQGVYGVDEGLIFSFPCVTRHSEICIVDGIEHTESFSQERLAATIAELRQEKATVMSLGLIKKK